MSEANYIAREQAYAAIADMVIKPSSLVEYQSRGRLLVIGKTHVLEAAQRFKEPLQVTVLLQEEGLPATDVVMAADNRILIRGHLGHFEVTIEGDATQILNADLILDTSPKPLLNKELTPFGYFHCDADVDAIMAMETELHDLIGAFEKPRYFSYDSNACAHSRSGIPGCTRCIDTCPAEAIVSIKDGIKVDPYLCQGGGVCSSVCPTGAIRYGYPSPIDTLQQIRNLLKTYYQAGGDAAVLVLCAEDDVASLPDLPANCLLLVLEEIASVGFEIWLSALAYGAVSVILYDGDSIPVSVRETLEQQLKIPWAILEGMGYAAQVLQLSKLPQAFEMQARMPAIQTASFTPLPDKRQMSYLSIDHLAEQAGMVTDCIDLPQDAPFGVIKINQSACTLCMACTSVCPSSAVIAGNGRPALNFLQSACVQCGLCMRACPEQAIDLEPKLITDVPRRTRVETLKEDEPFCCISCGRAFATRSIIDVVLGKLVAHPMFKTERQRQRLKMCEDCRVVDMAEDSNEELLQ